MPNTEFLITSLVVVLIPGTGVIYTVSTGLFQDWRASIAAACGCTACITDIPYPIPGRGEKMPKSVMFIIFIAVIILAGFLAYTQVQMLQ